MYFQRGLSPDELNQLNYVASPGLLPFWKKYTTVEITAFPGDYLLTFPFVQILGTSKWLIAIPHIITTIIGFYLFYVVCAKYLKSTLAFFFAFALICCNFNLNFHAFEFRPYAVLPTLALAVFFLSEYLVQNYVQLSRTRKVLIGLFFFLTVGFHAYGILIIALYMSFFILRESCSSSILKVMKQILPFCLILAVLAVPLFLWYYMQNPMSYGAHLSRNINTFDFIPNPLINIDGFLRSLLGNLVGIKKIYPLLIIGALIAFLIPQKDKLKQLWFLLFLIVLPIELVLVSVLNSGYWFLQRQFVWVMPFFAIWIAWCWDSIFIYCSQLTCVRNIFSQFQKDPV